jgi:hypothetical protein
MSRPVMPKCGTCLAFDSVSDVNGIGTCRLNSPSEISTSRLDEGVWPCVDPNSWCLQHVPIPTNHAHALVQRPADR